MKLAKTKPSRIVAEGIRRGPPNYAAVRYARSARKFVQRGAVAIRAVRCQLASVQLAKAYVTKAALTGDVTDAVEIRRADREVRSLERALRDVCLVARSGAKPKVKARTK
jgi:hypothetical protein